jgi:hypothetical protein
VDYKRKYIYSKNSLFVVAENISAVLLMPAGSKYGKTDKDKIMVSVKRLVLDVLKPHQPNALEFSMAIAEVGVDYCVHVTVLEVDENTETLQIEVAAKAIDFDAVQSAIADMGASLHSIDEVEVQSGEDAG